MLRVIWVYAVVFISRHSAPRTLKAGLLIWRALWVGVDVNQVRKAQERSEKCQKEMEAARQRYTRALLDLDSSNGKYQEDMVDVFDRTQTFERRRLEFLKSILLELHSSLDYSQNQALVYTLSLVANVKHNELIIDIESCTRMHSFNVILCVSWSNSYHTMYVQPTVKNYCHLYKAAKVFSALQW